MAIWIWSRVIHPLTEHAGTLDSSQAQPGPNDRQWIARSPKFLFHETPLGQHFRTLYRQALQERAPEALKELPDKIWKQHWRVDCEAVGSGEKALAYLARYVFKTATGNRQLQRLPSG